MNVKRAIAHGLVIGSLFTASWARGEATLLSVKRTEGSKGRAYTVFRFDENVRLIGLSQADGGRFSVYLGADAGGFDGTTSLWDSTLRRGMTIRSISGTPPILRIDIDVDMSTALAALKKNRELILAVNQDRLLDEKMELGPMDVSASPGRLVNVAPSTRNGNVLTEFQFDGTVAWIGFIRHSNRSLELIFHGSGLLINGESLAFENNPLRLIRFKTTDGDQPILRATLEVDEPVFSIAAKPKQIVFQAVQTRKSEAKPLAQVPASPAAGQVALGGQSVSKGRTDQAPKTKSGSQSLKTAVEASDPSVPAREEIPWNQIVSFQFTGTPIRDALRLVARSADLNMVITDGVKGSITMDLKNVSLREALDMIVNTHECEYIVYNRILTIKPVSIQYTGGRITKIYTLKYADAENVAMVIRQVASADSLVKVFHPEFLNFAEAGKNRIKRNEVAVQGIRRSSVLVVTDRPEKIRDVDRVIAQIDVSPIQIMIESKLVEMAPVRNNQLGINWDKTITAALQWQDILPGGDTKDFSVINESPDKGGEWKMGHLTATQFKAVLDFLREKTDSKLVSNPSLLAMDNEESSISVGTTVPVPRIQRGMGGQGDMVTFEYKEVNIQLNVTPHLTDPEEITMYVNPVIEEITGWVEYLQHRAPITDKRTVNSIVSVKNGETVVIGGLIKTQRVQTVQKVWLLGSIPLIGRLFQHEVMQDKQTDLMIFITPTIIKAE